MRSEAFETLFGGAAGGGKSHGQLLDALRFAVVYPGSRQLMLRRTMPELERSLVPAAMRLYPQSVASYKVSEHRWDFINGSTLEFGYCDAESDVTKYQSAEYDVIRFDELTHFTESQFTYLISRIRGANPYPKQVKSTTNPGGIGHQWVKSRYIDPMPPALFFQGQSVRSIRAANLARRHRGVSLLYRQKIAVDFYIFVSSDEIIVILLTNRAMARILQSY